MCPICQSESVNDVLLKLAGTQRAVVWLGLGAFAWSALWANDQLEARWKKQAADVPTEKGKSAYVFKCTVLIPLLA